MNIKDYLKQTSQAIKKGNAATEVAIIPKFIKHGYYQKMNPIDLAVLLCFYEHVNTETGQCYPKQVKIGELIGTDRPATISESISRLESLGFLHKVPARRRNRNGKLVSTASEIILTPFNKIQDEEYHRALIAEIDRIKYIIVEYVGNSTLRQIIGTGTNTNSLSERELNMVRQKHAKKPRTISKNNDVDALEIRTKTYRHETELYCEINNPLTEAEEEKGSEYGNHNISLISRDEDEAERLVRKMFSICFTNFRFDIDSIVDGIREAIAEIEDYNSTYTEFLMEIFQFAYYNVKYPKFDAEKIKRAFITKSLSPLGWENIKDNRKNHLAAVQNW